MKVQGVVHSCHPGNRQVTVQVGGKEMQAIVEGFVLEIVGESRSWTFDLHPDEASAFSVGQVVNLEVL